MVEAWRGSSELNLRTSMLASVHCLIQLRINGVVLW